MSQSALPVTDADLHAHCDGGLAKSRRRDVEAFLAANSDARARMRLWQQQQAQARAFLDPVLAEPVPLRLNIARLDGGAGGRAAAWRKTLFGFIGGFALGIALAGVLFLTLGGR
ncbi:MAG: anti-sigma factor family protein [Beijerinckiaceae bacterium]